MRKLMNDKKGVFGLTAVQSFFSIILGIALLAYVIVVVMGTLSETTILSQDSNTVTNETVGGTAVNITNQTSKQIANANNTGFGSFSVTNAYNGTGGALITSDNYTVFANGTILSTDTLCRGVDGGETTHYCGWEWLVEYAFSDDSNAQINSRGILGNTSQSVAGFFESIDPVYAILAILVIILVLVVLVRVVQTPNRATSTPQL